MVKLQFICSFRNSFSTSFSFSIYCIKKFIVSEGVDTVINVINTEFYSKIQSFFWISNKPNSIFKAQNKVPF